MQSPSAKPPDSSARLVIFGLSNILSDLLDAAYAAGVGVKAIVTDQPEAAGPRDLPAQARLDAYSRLAPRPQLVDLAAFSPEPGELYLLGPTTPQREHLASRLVARFGLRFYTLVHPRASVSPFASLGEGVFVGANSVIAAGAVLEDHVFVNRGVTIGHDTRIGSYSRLQPGVNLGGLTKLGRGVSVGLGANVMERLHIGDGAVVAGGAVVLEDVAPRVMVAGVPARVQKQLA
jgi:sugar O-acyltransferase (sialic acid O-acetyltransferase NeuD family)